MCISVLCSLAVGAADFAACHQQQAVLRLLFMLHTILHLPLPLIQPVSPDRRHRGDAPAHAAAAGVLEAARDALLPGEPLVPQVLVVHYYPSTAQCLEASCLQLLKHACTPYML